MVLTQSWWWLLCLRMLMRRVRVRVRMMSHRVMQWCRRFAMVMMMESSQVHHLLHVLIVDYCRLSERSIKTRRGK